MSSSDFEFQKLIELITLPAPKNLQLWMVCKCIIVSYDSYQAYTCQPLYLYLAKWSFAGWNILFYHGMYLTILVFVFVFVKNGSVSISKS